MRAECRVCAHAPLARASSHMNRGLFSKRAGARGGLSAHGEDEQPNEALRHPSAGSFRGRGRGRGSAVAPYPTRPSFAGRQGRGFQPRAGRGRGATVISTPNSRDPPPPRSLEAAAAEDDGSSASTSSAPRDIAGIRDEASLPGVSTGFHSFQDLLRLAGSNASTSNPVQVTLAETFASTSSTSARMHPERLALLLPSRNEPAAGMQPATPVVTPDAVLPTTAPSPPVLAVKRERTPTPPLSETAARYACDGRIHLPLPAECKRTVPTVRANRDAWKAKEVAALSALGLTAKPEIVRYDSPVVAVCCHSALFCGS